MLLHLLLRKLNVWILGGLATGIALLTSTVRQTTVNTWLLLPLGFTYPGFRSEDYFPLFPYLAVFIAGIIANKLYYYKGRSLFKFNLESRLLEKISRNSLLIYVLHQPVLMGLLLLYKYLPLKPLCQPLQSGFLPLGLTRQGNVYPEGKYSIWMV